MTDWSSYAFVEWVRTMDFVSNLHCLTIRYSMSLDISIWNKSSCWFVAECPSARDRQFGFIFCFVIQYLICLILIPGLTDEKSIESFDTHWSKLIRLHQWLQQHCSRLLRQNQHLRIRTNPFKSQFTLNISLSRCSWLNFLFAAIILEVLPTQITLAGMSLRKRSIFIND